MCRVVLVKFPLLRPHLILGGSCTKFMCEHFSVAFMEHVHACVRVRVLCVFVCLAICVLECENHVNGCA